MLLKLFHGRTSDQGRPTDLQGNPTRGWGFSGPVLHGISGFNQTFLDGPRFFFDSAADALVAHALTGWGDIPDLDCDDSECEATMHDNYKADQPANLIEANGLFYGDISVRDDQAIDELLDDEDHRLQHWFKIDGLLRLHTLNGIRDHGLDDAIDIFSSEESPFSFARRFIRRHDLEDANPHIWHGYDRRMTDPIPAVLRS